MPVYKVDVDSFLTQFDCQYADIGHIMSGRAGVRAGMDFQNGDGIVILTFGVEIVHAQVSKDQAHLHSTATFFHSHAAWSGIDLEQHEFPLALGDWRLIGEIDTDADTWSFRLLDANGGDTTYSGALTAGWLGTATLKQRAFLIWHKPSTWYWSATNHTSPDKLFGTRISHGARSVIYSTDGTPDLTEEFSDEVFNPPWDSQSDVEFAGHSVWGCADDEVTLMTDSYYPAPPYQGDTFGAFLTLIDIVPAPLAKGEVSLLQFSPGKIISIRTPGPTIAQNTHVERLELDGGWNKDLYWPAGVQYLNGIVNFYEFWRSPCLDSLSTKLLCGAITNLFETGNAAVGYITRAGLYLIGEVPLVNPARIYSEIEISVRPGGTGVDVLALDTPAGGPNSWYQSVGLFDREMGELTFCTPVSTSFGGGTPADFRGSLKRWASGGLMFALIPAGPGAEGQGRPVMLYSTGLALDGNGSWTQMGILSPVGAPPIGMSYIQVEIACAKPWGVIVGMLLVHAEHGHGPRWCVVKGQPSHAADSWDFCDPYEPAEFPDASDMRGGLIQLPDSSWLFAFVDVAGDTRFWRAPSIANDGTSTWTEVAL